MVISFVAREVRLETSRLQGARQHRRPHNVGQAGSFAKQKHCSPIRAHIDLNLSAVIEIRPQTLLAFRLNLSGSFRYGFLLCFGKTAGPVLLIDPLLITAR